ncbi:Signaling mucin MSB2 [Ceratocystis platani]|uniref:Signaling mucin MSB2 n=1 Tax=Ceratocystis fimbriata f. sp. platani TaxID=88771 RepID=A0A0F8B0B8_CERFI|nr:Signaling mucin MSB2 [Ceratocystis platani]
MQVKAIVLGTALAMASTAASAELRPRFYFPRQVKREFTNSDSRQGEVFARANSAESQNNEELPVFTYSSKNDEEEITFEKSVVHIAEVQDSNDELSVTEGYVAAYNNNPTAYSSSSSDLPTESESSTKTSKSSTAVPTEPASETTSYENVKTTPLDLEPELTSYLTVTAPTTVVVPTKPTKISEDTSSDYQNTYVSQPSSGKSSSTEPFVSLPVTTIDEETSSSTNPETYIPVPTSFLKGTGGSSYTKSSSSEPYTTTPGTVLESSSSSSSSEPFVTLPTSTDAASSGFPESYVTLPTTSLEDTTSTSATSTSESQITLPATYVDDDSTSTFPETLITIPTTVIDGSISSHLPETYVTVSSDEHSSTEGDRVATSTSSSSEYEPTSAPAASSADREPTLVLGTGHTTSRSVSATETYHQPELTASSVESSSTKPTIIPGPGASTTSSSEQTTTDSLLIPLPESTSGHVGTGTAYTSEHATTTDPLLIPLPESTSGYVGTGTATVSEHTTTTDPLLIPLPESTSEHTTTTDPLLIPLPESTSGYVGTGTAPVTPPDVETSSNELVATSSDVPKVGYTSTPGVETTTKPVVPLPQSTTSDYAAPVPETTGSGVATTTETPLVPVPVLTTSKLPVDIPQVTTSQPTVDLPKTTSEPLIPLPEVTSVKSLLPLPETTKEPSVPVPQSTTTEYGVPVPKPTSASSATEITQLPLPKTTSSEPLVPLPELTSVKSLLPLPEATTEPLATVPETTGVPHVTTSEPLIPLPVLTSSKPQTVPADKTTTPVVEYPSSGIPSATASAIETFPTEDAPIPTSSAVSTESSGIVLGPSGIISSVLDEVSTSKVPLIPGTSADETYVNTATSGAATGITTPIGVPTGSATTSDLLRLPVTDSLSEGYTSGAPTAPGSSTTTSGSLVIAPESTTSYLPPTGVPIPTGTQDQTTTGGATDVPVGSSVIGSSAGVPTTGAESLITVNPANPTSTGPTTPGIESTLTPDAPVVGGSEGTGRPTSAPTSGAPVATGTDTTALPSAAPSYGDAKPIDASSSSSDAVEHTTDVPAAPTTTLPPVTSIAVVSYIQNTQDWLGTQLVQDTAAPTIASDAPAPTAYEALPSDIPSSIDSGVDIVQPDKSTLVRLCFDRNLHYGFVAKNFTAAQQIFANVPHIVSYAEDIALEDVKVMSLVPLQTMNTLGFITTCAHMYVPSDIVTKLSSDIGLANSKVYSNPILIAAQLAATINTSINIIPGADEALVGNTAAPTNSPKSGTKGSTGNTDGKTGENGGLFGSKTSDDDNAPQSPKQKGATVGIAVGAIFVAAGYGAAMFIVARRYKSKKQSHRRSSSISNTSSDMQQAEAGIAPPMMGGALMSREFSSYGAMTPGERESHGSGRSAGPSVRAAGISPPVAAENSLGWN